MDFHNTKNNVQVKEYTNFKNNLKHDIRGPILIILVIMCYFMFTEMLLWEAEKSNDFAISLTQNERLINKVSSKFLSFGLDFSLLRHLKKLPINEYKFINLVKHLSPAYIRIGGTAADCVYFNLTTSKLITEDQDLENSSYSSIDSIDNADISNFTLTSSDFLSLYKFTKRAGVRMIFDLNVLLRNPNGSWNSDNARQIINFAKAHQMELDWQLGNEPNSFFHVFKVKISAEQLAKDYCKLRSLLDNSGYQGSILVGPEANHIGGSGDIYIKTFLSNINNCVDFVTWHQYYLSGHIAQVQDFVNVTIFNYLPMQIRTIEKVIKRSEQNIAMWLSETSTAYGGGAPELSNRFVAGFLWLDKLGYSAKTAVQVVIRQSFFGGNYAMVGHDLEPNPDWWVAALYKKFVSEKVLALAVRNNFDKLRLYAHCATKAGRVVLYGVNLSTRDTKINIKGLPKEAQVYSYFLTSDNLQSRNIFVNEKILKLKSDGSLPDFVPLIVKGNEAILIPPYSMFYLVIEGMEVAACL